MPWVRIDDRFDEHPKHAAVGPVGWGVWLAGLAYCNRNLTDGFIPRSVALMIGGRWEVLTPCKDGREQIWTIDIGSGHSGDNITTEWVVARLLEAGLWDEVPGGYRVHDYADYQPTKAAVLAERAAKRAAGRAGGIQSAVARQAAAEARAQADAEARAQAAAQAESKQNSSPYPYPYPYLKDKEERHAEDGVTSPVPAATAESAGTEETAGAHADPTQNAAARSGSADAPTPQASPANAASAATAPGNGESGRAPGLPGIDPGPARGAAAKRRESAASEQRVFAAWQEAMGRPDSVLDAARRRRIAWAVREYGEARAVAAIRGCAATPWNMGENEQRKRWDDLTLIFRDATHVERFLAADAAHGGEKSAREKAAAIARELRASGDAAE